MLCAVSVSPWQIDSDGLRNHRLGSSLRQCPPAHAPLWPGPGATSDEDRPPRRSARESTDAPEIGAAFSIPERPAKDERSRRRFGKERVLGALANTSGEKC